MFLALRFALGVAECGAFPGERAVPRALQAVSALLEPSSYQPMPVLVGCEPPPLSHLFEPPALTTMCQLRRPDGYEW